MIFLRGEKLFCYHLKEMWVFRQDLRLFYQVFGDQRIKFFLISNLTSLCKCLMQIPLNQWITVWFFFRRFKRIAPFMFLLALSKIALLIRLPLLKFLYGLSELWNCRCCHLFPTGLVILFSKICFPSALICFLCRCCLCCISRLRLCLSYDRILLLLISKGFLFYLRIWLSYAMIWLTECLPLIFFSENDF